LSKLDPKVHWRLNDLLRAGKKAKEFAAVSWSDPAEQLNEQFVPWHPEDTQNQEELDTDKVLELQDDISPLETLSPSQIENNPSIQAALVQAREDAFKEGFQQGSQQAEGKYHDALKTAQRLAQNLQTKQDNIAEFYDPLKKLSLHLAQELVRGELALSQHSIQRLVSEAIDLIEEQGVGKIIVTLHPDDAEGMLNIPDASIEDFELRTDTHLSRGSVRVTMGDTVIEDLIESRLQEIADQMYHSNTSQDKNTQISNEEIKTDERSNEESFDESVGNTKETRVSSLQQNTVDPLDDKDETDE
jgi:flagellar biosynthesis/type III secretory pathway protein FliH